MGMAGQASYDVLAGFHTCIVWCGPFGPNRCSSVWMRWSWSKVWLICKVKVHLTIQFRLSDQMQEVTRKNKRRETGKMDINQLF